MKFTETNANNTKLSEYTAEMFKNWDVVWDHSNSYAVEFVAKQGKEVVYVRYQPLFLEKVPPALRAKELAWKTQWFEDAKDFYSFAEVKNDARLKKISL